MRKTNMVTVNLKEHHKELINQINSSKVKYDFFNNFAIYLDNIQYFYKTSTLDERLIAMIENNPDFFKRGSKYNKKAIREFINKELKTFFNSIEAKFMRLDIEFRDAPQGEHQLIYNYTYKYITLSLFSSSSLASGSFEEFIIVLYNALQKGNYETSATGQKELLDKLFKICKKNLTLEILAEFE